MGDIIDTQKLEDYEGFQITFNALVEYDSPDWDFESEEERLELLRKIDTYQVTWFCAQIIASKNGIKLGYSYLGGCCYDSYEDFIKETAPDLIFEAVEEAKKNIKMLCESVQA